MADIIDQAQDKMEYELEQRIKAARGIVLPASDNCLYCEEPTENGARFCCVECREDYERDERLAKMRGRE